jgi:hypothetical protein
MMDYDIIAVVAAIFTVAILILIYVAIVSSMRGPS